MLSYKENYSLDYTLSQEIQDSFIDAFKDTNPIHINEDYAKSKGFQARIMHGNILSGFISHFVGVEFELENIVIASQSMNFHKPVFVNEILRLKVKVKDYLESVKVYNVSFKFYNSENEKVASGKLLLKRV